MNIGSKKMEEEIVYFVIAPYALADVILALHNSGVREIYVTMIDDDIVIRIPKDKLEKAVYDIEDNKIYDSCCNGIK